MTITQKYHIDDLVIYSFFVQVGWCGDQKEYRAVGKVTMVKIDELGQKIFYKISRISKNKNPVEIIVEQDMIVSLFGNEEDIARYS